MNLMKYPRGEYSIDHFSRPNSWELEGKSYEELTNEIPAAMERILDGSKDDLLNAFRNGYLLGEVR